MTLRKNIAVGVEARDHPSAVAFHQALADAGMKVARALGIAVAKVQIEHHNGSYWVVRGETAQEVD